MTVTAAARESNVDVVGKINKTYESHSDSFLLCMFKVYGLPNFRHQNDL